jgi:hypothetical protein
MSGVPWWTDAAWYSAMAAGALVVITAVATIVGGRAAQSAARTYRLESEPLIVVRKASQQNQDHASADLYIVLAPKAVAEGLELRKWRLEDNTMAEGWTAADVGGQPRAKRLTFEIRNVGRSPAVEPVITWDLSTPTLPTPTTKVLADLEPVTAVGAGFMRLPSLPAGDVAYVIVENRLTSRVTLKAYQDGFQTDWTLRKRTRMSIAVVASTEFSIAGSS